MTAIAKEYGTALFMLACEKNKQEEYAAALDELKSAFDDNPDYILFLTSLSIPLSERLEAIEKAFAGRLPEDVVSYMQLLCEKGRIGFFYEAAEEYRKLLDESMRVSKAKITSAAELSEEEKAALVKKLEDMNKTSVEAEYFVDESLIGGVVAEIDGKVMDGSLRSRLRDIKEVING